MSTTVINPSIWMDIYNERRTSAFFFILFGVVCIFYLHSLVLSTVFNNYIAAMAHVVHRFSSNKERCLLHAFNCLQEEAKRASYLCVRTEIIEDTLRQLRPHYNDHKVQ